MNNAFWDKAVAFHGHACPGLAIGARACEAAIEEGEGRSYSLLLPHSSLI